MPNNETLAPRSIGRKHLTFTTKQRNKNANKHLVRIEVKPKIITAAETIPAGCPIGIDETGKARRGSDTYATYFPIIGFAIEEASYIDEVIRYVSSGNLISGVTDLEPGKKIWLSNNTITTALPTLLDGKCIQELGIALSTNSIAISIKDMYVINAD